MNRTAAMLILLYVSSPVLHAQPEEAPPRRPAKYHYRQDSPITPPFSRLTIWKEHGAKSTTKLLSLGHFVERVSADPLVARH